MDSVVSEESVHELAQRLSKQKNIDVDYRMIPGADHFFRDKIDILNSEIDDYLRSMFNHQESKGSKKPTPKTIKTKPAKKIFLE